MLDQFPHDGKVAAAVPGFIDIYHTTAFDWESEGLLQHSDNKAGICPCVSFRSQDHSRTNGCGWEDGVC